MYVQVTIRYGPDAVDGFIEIADAVEERFPDLQVDGDEAEELTDGAFEVLADDGRVLQSASKEEFIPEAVIKALEASNIS